MNQLSFLHLDRLMRMDGRSGQKAVMTGQEAEDTIFDMLRRRNLDVKRQAHIGESIYGHPMACDFLIKGLEEYPKGLIIESKWQASGGSVDEKFPYLVENIMKRFPCPAIIILAGGGAKAGAVKWLRAQVDGQKLVGVMTLEGFMTWAMNNL